MNEWMEYLPDFMSPWGMIFYSFFVYLLVMLHSCMRKRTVEKYVDKSLRNVIQKSLEESRKKRT